MISLGRSHPGRLSASLLLVAASATAAVVLPGAAAAKKPAKKPAKAKVVGRVYTETNSLSNNQVIIFNRLSNGKLRQIGAVSTGGKGARAPQPGCTPPGGCPVVDTQNEVLLTSDAKLLFAVNAGSNTITSFRTTAHGLRRANEIDSGGQYPNSLTVHGHLLYVLNSSSDNIAGFVFTASGKLIPIKNSSQKLIGGLPGAPRQVGFDNTGKVLMVSLLANSSGPPPAGGTKATIDTFPVNGHGQARPGTAHNSTKAFPFAFAFDKQNQAIMAQLNKVTPGAGSAQRYTAAGGAVGPAASTVDAFPCWVVVTKNGRHVYIVNTGGGAPGGATVVAYRISPSGALTRQQVTQPLNEFVKTDEALSGDDQYLYVISPLYSGKGTPGGNSVIDEYRVLANGNLKLIGRTEPLPLPSLSGLAAS